SMSMEKSIATTSAVMESKFQPNVFTNQPDVEADVKLSPGRKNLKQWLGCLVRVTLRNKLRLMGIFSCTDHDQNVIITNCNAYLADATAMFSNGNVMVPGNEITAFEV
ncbi:hypothetical protein KR215_001944, partial [Drosophila sulfurigaster]